MKSKAVSNKNKYMFRVVSKKRNHFRMETDYYPTVAGVNQKLRYLEDDEIIAVEYIEANWKPVTHDIAPGAAARILQRAFEALTGD